MRYRLRSLLMLLAVGPPLLAGSWAAYREHVRRTEEMRRERFRLLMTITPPLIILEEEDFALGVKPSEP